MRAHLARWVLAAVLAGTLAGVERPAHGQADLRQRYNTNNMDAARRIRAGVELIQARKPREGLAELEAATKLDPDCGFAWYWKALAESDIGEIEKSLESSKKAVTLFESQGAGTMVAEAATNLGLMYATLKELDDARHWFSRAVVADPSWPGLWKPYRNMAVSLHSQKKLASAAVAALLAAKVSPERAQAMADDFLRQASDDETARVLYLEGPVPKVTAREGLAGLKPVELPGVEGKVTQLVPDPAGNAVLAVVRESGRLYRIGFGVRPVAKQIPLEANVLRAAAAGGRVYVSVNGPARILELEGATGKVLRTHSLGSYTADSIAPTPSRGVISFVHRGKICVLSIDSQTVTETTWPGQVLATDPGEAYIYFRTKDAVLRPAMRTIIIDGRPVMITEAGGNDWNQTTLGKLYVGPKGSLVLAALRMNAAANGFDVTVSPDGKWVSVPGGGGWRPSVPAPAGRSAGYTVAVFAAGNMEHVQATLGVGAYPKGVAFNAVTGQAATVREQEVAVFDLARDEKPAATAAGKYLEAIAWSPDGKYLLAASADGGVKAHENTLTRTEAAVGTTWLKSIVVEKTAGPAKKAVEPMPGLASFRPGVDRSVVLAAVEDAISKSRSSLAPPWPAAGYGKDTPAPAELQEILDDTRMRERAGIRIFRLRKLLKTSPGFVPALYFMGDAQSATGQHDEAIATLTAVVHLDQGRTVLTPEALVSLSKMHELAKRTLPAVHCAAVAVQADRGRAESVERLHAALTAAGMADQARRVAAMKAHTSSPGDLASAAANLPVLTALPPLSPALKPDVIYERCAPSVVLVKCGASTGTGVCVGKPGVIVTSHHVVDGGQAIEVIPFGIKGGKARKLAAVPAEIVASNRGEDLAVLVMKAAPEGVGPLSVAVANPKPGEKVFAIGHPGLGHETLDLSLSDGIISSSSRVLGGHVYLQHTAGVNPGNSGGPLLNARGEVVGIVCMTADLKSVSFATPAETLRKLFPEKK